jgi:hypothetical protein
MLRELYPHCGRSSSSHATYTSLVFIHSTWPFLLARLVENCISIVIGPAAAQEFCSIVLFIFLITA